MGYHTKKIKKGTYGALSKITEEYQELLDAVKQRNTLMTLIELSDLLGAIDGYALSLSKGSLGIEDLLIMTRATQSVFREGSRK